MAGMAAPGERSLGMAPWLGSPMGAHGGGMRVRTGAGMQERGRTRGWGWRSGIRAGLGGTWDVRGCPSRSHRTAGRGLPDATQLQRRSDPMSASVSEITSSHSGWAAGDKREGTEPRGSAERWQCQAGRRTSLCQRCRHSGVAAPAFCARLSPAGIWLGKIRIQA